MVRIGQRDLKGEKFSNKYEFDINSVTDFVYKENEKGNKRETVRRIVYWLIILSMAAVFYFYHFPTEMPIEFIERESESVVNKSIVSASIVFVAWMLEGLFLVGDRNWMLERKY